MESDDAEIDVLLKAVGQVVYTDSARARAVAAEALRRARGALARARGDADRSNVATERLVRALSTNASLAMYEGRQDDGLSFAGQGLRLAEEVEDLAPQVRLLRMLGRLHSDLGDGRKALSLLWRSHALAKTLNDARGLERVHHHLGVAESRLGNEGAALEHYRAALSHAPADGGFSHLMLQGNIALSLRKLGRYAEALTLREAVHAGALEASSPPAVANSLIERGVIHHRLGDWSSAHRDLEHSVALTAEDPGGLAAAAHLYLAELLLDPDNPSYDPEAALTHLLGPSASAQGEDRQSVYRALSRAYAALGRPEEALVHFRRYHEMVVEEHRRVSDRVLADARADLNLSAVRDRAEAASTAQLALQAANEELTDAVQGKQTLLDMMRHDLRGEIMVLLWLADALEETARGGPATLVDDVDQVRQVAQRMVAIVDHMTGDAERGDGASGGREVVELGPLIHEVIKEYEPIAAAKDMHFVVAGVASVTVSITDPTNLSRALANLVSNAVKYAYPGTTIEVVAEQSEHDVSLVVADRGPGLTDDDIAAAFRPFRRLSARPTGGEQSTGLGLSIVDRLMRDLGGRAWCEKRPGGGARFGLTVLRDHPTTM